MFGLPLPHCTYSWIKGEGQTLDRLTDEDRVDGSLHDEQCLLSAVQEVLKATLQCSDITSSIVLFRHTPWQLEAAKATKVNTVIFICPCDLKQRTKDNLRG